MTTPQQAYNLYMTVKKHYSTPKYSAFKNKPVRVPESRFLYRPERYRMKRLCERFKTPKDLIQYFVANFALETSDFLYQPEDYGDSSFMRWEAYKQSISYNLKGDVDTIVSYMERMHITVEDLHRETVPMQSILHLMITGKISIQSVVLLDEIYNFLTAWADDVNMNPLYATHALRVHKTKGFIKADKALISNIARGLESVEYEQSFQI